ncbi:hypothetical protein RRG08_020370 [Elysia crispata]|uniref:Uncharacterized protein n=1 Tax=Elysia crispata TaxID=231223 RepID=A0AAE1AHV1_9GAST|nr:hypothetical protein RRG08_020370 [Elysia crispata]
MGKNSDLLRAIRRNDIFEVETVLASGKCSLNKRSSRTNPPLIECVTTGNRHSGAAKKCDIIKTLVACGADVNITDSGDRKLTAAMWAAMFGCLVIVKTLGECGADFNIRSAEGETALILALGGEHIDIVKYLVPQMSVRALNYQRDDGATAVSLAARDPGRFSVRCLNILTAAGADVDVRDADDCTALMSAVRRTDSQAVKLLLGKGANINALTESGKSPLTIALKYNLYDYRTILELLRHGADPAMTRRDRTHLHYMVYKPVDVLVKALVAHGFPPLDIQCHGMIKSKTRLKRRDHLPPLAPLCGRPKTAKYLIASRFFTKFDIVQLCWDSKIRKLLQLHSSESRENSRNQSLEILEFLSTKPHSLFTLSKVAVTSALTFDLAGEGRVQTGARAWDCGPSYRAKINRLGLPPLLKAELWHQTPSAGVCLKTWEDISLGNETLFETCSCRSCEPDYSSSDRRLSNCSL